MTLSSTTILSIVELAIYLPLVPLSIYLAIKHGLLGLLGYIYLIIFITLRIVTDGLQISERNQPTSATAAIINSIGISPLLLALAGFLHESTRRLNPLPPHHRYRLLHTVLQIFFHFAAIGGVAIAAVGGSKLADPPSASNKYSTDHALREAGSLILLLVWSMLLAYLIWIYRTSTSARTSAHAPLAHKAQSSGKRLLLSTALAAPFVGVRALYGVVYAFDRSPSVNPATGSFAIRFLLIFLVQLIAAVSLLTGGWLSRKIVAETRRATVAPVGTLARAEDGPLSHVEARELFDTESYGMPDGTK